MLLPRGLLPSRLSARTVAPITASLAVAVLVYAWFYPPFDGGKLRPLLVLTSTGFAAAVTIYAIGARTRLRAVGRAMAVSTLLGIANTFAPAALLSHEQRADIGAYLFFGVLFGAPVGFVYGVPLAMLASLTQPHVDARDATATDRASRNAGVFLAVLAAYPAVVALSAIFVMPGGPSWWAEEAVSVAGLAIAACAGGIVLAVRASLRLARRRAWIAGVWAGRVPGYRVRMMTAADERLPRLADGEAVVEWLPEDPGATTAYRAAAGGGVALAIVDGGVSRRS